MQRLKLTSSQLPALAHCSSFMFDSNPTIYTAESSGPNPKSQEPARNLSLINSFLPPSLHLLLAGDAGPAGAADTGCPQAAPGCPISPPSLPAWQLLCLHQGWLLPVLLGNELMTLFPRDRAVFPGSSGTSPGQEHFCSELFAESSFIRWCFCQLEHPLRAGGVHRAGTWALGLDIRVCWGLKEEGLGV